MSEINARESFDFATNSSMQLSRKMKIQTTKLQDELAEKKQKLDTDYENKMEVDDFLDTSQERSQSTSEVKEELLHSDDGCEDDFKMNLSSSDDSDAILPAKVFKRYKCEFCKKRYVDKRSFKYHVEAHTGKKYYCDLCPNRIFKNKMSYDRHIKFHEGGNKYIFCKMCSDKFEELYQLISHKKNMMRQHCHVCSVTNVKKNSSIKVIKRDIPSLHTER